jgi:hypothetical protein
VGFTNVETYFIGGWPRFPLVFVCTIRTEGAPRFALFETWASLRSDHYFIACPAASTPFPVIQAWISGFRKTGFDGGMVSRQLGSLLGADSEAGGSPQSVPLAGTGT